ncbi:MAG: DUF362 domain-containing protein, partial [Bacteroidales bacterium]|nr:DUF362 domain-containing protein [Bacteroidales bacterium]
MGYNNKRKKINLIFKKLKFNKFSTKVIFFITGIAATMWFLIRVIPKPSRASYPCMRASAPIMSGFILYLISLPASVFLLKKAKNKIRQSKYWIAAVCFAGFIISTTFFVINNNFKTKALAETDPASIIPNNPIGTPHGIFPGRVVWVHDPDATNEDMLNTAGHYWYEDENVNQDVIEKMLADGIRKLTGQDTVAGAWNKLCEYFNEKHGKGSVGYTSGEKFFIKINVTNSCCNMSGTEKVGDKQRMDATPQLMLVLLKQLIEEVGVAQSDISIGDPYRTFRDEYWDKCHTVYPDVKYYDGRGINGRIQTQPSSEQLLKFSDGNNTSSIPQSYLDADYFINLPCLKSHDVGGITLGAKNHQGSVLEEGDAPQNQSAMYMHYSLPGESEGIGLYRHLVDYLGHKDLGGKTLITIIDAIWSGENWEGNIEKWQIFPFNNDYTSSVFLSQDLVAIESVCYDFLLEEYKDRTTRRFPYMLGADDYLYQAASSDYWPTGIVYDPEGDGTPIGSLGVFEHWNNATDMKYSKNLGTGNGIEFIKLSKVLGPQIISEFKNISYENTGIELVITDSLLLHFEDNSGDSIIFTVTTGHDSLTATITNNNILSIKTDYNFIDTIQVVVTATNSNSSTEASFKVYINTGKKYIAKKAKTAPVLDGDPSDSCWSNVNWTLINQVWLPYGSVVSANDFNGKYKAVWTQDSLYLLAEIYDDVLDVGNPNITVNYWQYDCLELFIDEDKSGGEHENNFNAFAYHLSAEGN